MKSVAITGALSYTGRYLSKALLDSGTSSVLSFSRRKVPISSHILSPTDLSRITTAPLNFDDREGMKEKLEGLFLAAKSAGVSKVVFSSHTRTSPTSPFSYIRGKALAESYLRSACSDGSMNYSIVRPCGIFGDTPGESILMNNAAWVMRRTPLFLLAGGGGETFQPVHVRDMAELMAQLGRSVETSGEEKDAVGPDAPTALELFRRLNGSVGGRGFVVPSGLPTRVIGAMTK
ncbi:hypothetical protein TrRE_jg12183, partial [Triparma retinervis]